jgi:hypothetical protein
VYHHHCDITDHARPSCGDVFKHFKARVRWTRGSQFSEIFQSYCNLGNNVLELASILWLKVCSRSKLLPRHRTRAGYRGFLLPPSVQSLQDGGSVVIAISPQNPHIATTAHTTHTYT